MTLLALDDITRTFRRPHAPDLPVLQGVNLRVEAGQFHAILGKSGSGKSTLIQLMALFDRPCSGRVLWQGQDATSLRPSRQDKARQALLGFVHQHHHLISDLSAMENVALPLRIQGLSKPKAQACAEEWLSRVGLEGRFEHYPGELSGGERQRVGVARAMAPAPQVLIADEPTGNLDQETGRAMMGMFERLRQERGMALVLVTHDLALAQAAPHRWALEGGALRAS